MSKYVLFLFAASAVADTAPIADENLRMSALQAIFPGVQISLVPGKRIRHSSTKRPGPYELDSPDALAKEKVYRVIGKAMNEAERCASEDLGVFGKFSDRRLLRFQFFHWPGTEGLLAVLQYNFEDANPALACSSLGLLVQLANVDGKFTVQDQYLLKMQHHSSLQAIRMLDLTGAAVDQLVIESDFGGVGTSGSSLQIFDLGHSRFEEILSIVSRISQEIDEMYTQVIDVPNTIKQGGAQFCFTKTTMFEGGKPAIPPRISNPCYKRGEGIDRREAEERNKMLAPFPHP